jgi:hypothetical protein
MIPHFRDFVTAPRAGLPDQWTVGASSFAAIIPEDVNQALLMTGSEAGQSFEGKLVCHVASQAILSQFGIVTIKVCGLLH